MNQIEEVKNKKTLRAGDLKPGDIFQILNWDGKPQHNYYMVVKAATISPATYFCLNDGCAYRGDLSDLDLSGIKKVDNITIRSN